MKNKGLKNNTGLDLKHLFIGTEGTLGVITRVVLRLFPKPERRYSALAAVDDLGHVLEILKQARASLPGLSDRKSVVWGKSVSVRLDLGGRRIVTKKTQ